MANFGQATTMREMKEDIRRRHGGFRSLKKIGYSTAEYTTQDKKKCVRYHQTDIIVWDYPNGEIILNTNGWQGATTKRKLNQFSPFDVYQKATTWYINHPLWDAALQFKDGMRFNLYTFEPINA